MYFSEAVGAALADVPVLGDVVRAIGFDDLVVLRAVNPDGSGVFVAAPTRRAKGLQLPCRFCSAGRGSRHTLRRSLRLRRRAIDVAGADAVLDLDGGLVEASSQAVNARDRLRSAVRHIERARSASGRRHPDAAIDAWTALVDGRWSLVDHFESDGKRFMLAVENPAEPPRTRAPLSPEERPVLHLVAMGHANKLIAYELGLPLGTVASRLKSIMHKLGVQTRVEIVDR